jgi:hypothetical protein
MAGLSPVSGAHSPCNHKDATLSMLRAYDVGSDSIPKAVEMTKRFFLGTDGSLQKTSYLDASTFESFRIKVDGIRPMGRLLHLFASNKQRNWAIIRGISEDGHLASTRRNDKVFQEHPEGSDWVMLDIDNESLPSETIPYSKEAIVWVIENKLPAEFRGVTCYYQFSSSAGVCKADGALLKSGLCVHLFFFLNRRVQGKKLAAYLRLQCMTSGFYRIDNNKGGVATITHGIDPAPIRSAVQVHYISNPIIAKGVTCLLSEKDREGFIDGDCETVQLPELPANIVSSADLEQSRRLTSWKEANGYRKVVSQVHTENGIATVAYFKPAIEGISRVGRNLVGVKMGSWQKPNDICTLVLENENSPGSWYVLRAEPSSARRYDGTKIPLREFSDSAYLYVRDELQWLIDVPYQLFQLTAEGRLPEIDSFATAQHSLILAPTGSGKTYRMTEWMGTKSSSTLVIYVAQTIPLVNQMGSDLAANNIPYHHYDGFDYFYTPNKGIFLTTNESLHKILGVVGMSRYVLVVDEFHRALDDFARSDTRLSEFKVAITQAERVVYMTGTLTAIQRNMLGEIVSSILGRRITAAGYCCYEFPSVKQYPLHILNLSTFQSDFIDLFERYSELHKNNQPIPQTVIILNTSRMEIFNQIVSHYDLGEVIEVVSRPENLPLEIEAARTTRKPILIASPLFSIGLNFECDPEVLWCRFDKLDADTSQIVQTINRANRGVVACSVKIYAGEIDQKPFVFPHPNSVRAKLAAIVEDESELSNPGYDTPMMLDRMIYNKYRTIERNTNKSLGMLIRENAFQNYIVAEMFHTPRRDKAKHNQYGRFRDSGNAVYDQSVVDWYDRIMPNRHVMFLLEDAKKLAQKHRVNYKAAEQRTDRDFEEEELALIMHICQLALPAQARKVRIAKLEILFGMREPWMTDSRKAGKFSQNKKASALKLKELIHLVDALGRLATGELDGLSFAIKLNKDKKIQKGFVALATGERDFISVNESFEQLAKLRDVYRKSRSAESKGKAESFAAGLIVELMGELGVVFAVEGRGRNKQINLSSPILPSTWNFPSMLAQLHLLIELLESFPDAQPLEWEWAPINYTFGLISTCVKCKSFYLGRCLRGDAVDFGEWGIHEPLGIDSSWQKCGDFAPRRES